MTSDAFQNPTFTPSFKKRLLRFQDGCILGYWVSGLYTASLKVFPAVFMLCCMADKRSGRSQMRNEAGADLGGLGDSFSACDSLRLLHSLTLCKL